MSTTRPYPAGDRGPDSESAATTAAAPDAGRPPAGADTTGTADAPGAVGGRRAPQDDSSGAAGADERRRAMRQVRRLRLVGAHGAVARARDFTRHALHDWGWLPAVTADQRAAAEDVLLVVSELVTNACLHADGPEELRIGNGPCLLRLEVVDPGSGSPAPRSPHRAGRPGGHGMFIVQRLCRDWGVVRNPGGTGKTVWAEFAAPGA